MDANAAPSKDLKSFSRATQAGPSGPGKLIQLDPNCYSYLLCQLGKVDEYQLV
jgi:hypothetical protein